MPCPPRTVLAELIVGRMAALGMGRADLVRLLGFRNAAKGLRRFDAFLAAGQPTSDLLDRLPQVLGIHPAELDFAAEATRREIAEAAEAEARARFVPHVLVETKAQPGVDMPIFIQALAWKRERVLDLPDGFQQKHVSRQLRFAARLVRAHYRRCSGRMGTWGRIVGYRLQRTFDHAVLMRTDGTILEGFVRQPQAPAPVLVVKGKVVPPGIFGRG